MYIRKTRDEYDIEQYTGPQYGWEVSTCEDSYKEARERRKEYRENQPEFPVRIVKRRVKIDVCTNTPAKGEYEASKNR